MFILMISPKVFFTRAHKRTLAGPTARATRRTGAGAVRESRKAETTDRPPARRERKRSTAVRETPHAGRLQISHLLAPIGITADGARWHVRDRHLVLPLAHQGIFLFLLSR